MSALLINTLSRIPVPLFGSAATAFELASRKATALPRFAPWALPVGAGAMWFVWPAVTDDFRITLGLLPDPEAEKEAAEAAKAESIELSDEAKAKIETAYKAEEEVKLSKEERLAMRALESGNHSAFNNDWDTFMEKSIKPGEDDDDDDDDDDDEDEEEEEEEGEEEEDE